MVVMSRHRQEAWFAWGVGHKFVLRKSLGHLDPCAWSRRQVSVVAWEVSTARVSCSQHAKLDEMLVLMKRS